MPVIPAREPIGDVISGTVQRQGDQHVLVVDPAEKPLMIRYAVQYLSKPHWAIVPGLIALDYGEMLTGEVAWEFLLKRSNLHPRADVVGYRNDGKDEMVTVKTLDLAQSIYVLAYGDAAATTPIAQIAAMIAPADAPIPPRLLEFLPRYDTVTDWQAAHE